MATAPSTAQNPIKAAMDQVVGQNALSTGTGTTAPISYDDLSGFRSPQQDVISITSSPGSGASTAETWSHEADLERLKQAQMEFQYSQQQNELANAIRQQENQRAGEKLALDRAMHEATMRQMQQQYQQGQEELALKKQASEMESANFMRQYGPPSYYTGGQYARDQRNAQIANAGQLAAWNFMQNTGIPQNQMNTMNRAANLPPEQKAYFNYAFNNQLNQRTPDVQR